MEMMIRSTKEKINAMTSTVRAYQPRPAAGQGVAWSRVSVDGLVFACLFPSAGPQNNHSQGSDQATLSGPQCQPPAGADQSQRAHASDRLHQDRPQPDGGAGLPADICHAPTEGSPALARYPGDLLRRSSENFTRQRHRAPGQHPVTGRRCGAVTAAPSPPAGLSPALPTRPWTVMPCRREPPGAPPPKSPCT